MRLARAEAKELATATAVTVPWKRAAGILPALEFGHLPLNAPGDAKGVSSYQPGATPQEQVRESIAERQRRDSSVHRHEPPVYPDGVG